MKKIVSVLCVICLLLSVSIVLPTSAQDDRTNILAGKLWSGNGFDYNYEGAAHGSMTDGDKTTSRWHCGAGETAQQITFDLQGMYNLDEIVIYWEGAYASEYEVQFSVDAADWENVYSTDVGVAGEKIIKIAPKITRYIRIVCKTPGTEWGYSIYEVEAYGTAADNIALGKEVKANVGSNATAITDGVQSSGGWATYSTPDFDAEIYVDLGQLYEVDYVCINWETAYASEYEVQFSVDAVNWETVYSTDAGAAGLKAIEIPSKFTRYIQIVCKKAATQWGYTIYEVEAYGTAVNNIALGKAVKANTGYNMAGLTDGVQSGDNKCRWATNPVTFDAEVSADLGQLYEVDYVFINWEGAYAAEYEVQFSIDAVNWETVYSTDAGAAGVKAIKITPKTTRYIQIVCKTPGTPYGYSIWEVEAYGTAADNIAFGKDVAANTGSNASAITDGVQSGDYSNRWATNITTDSDAEIYVDLGQLYEVNHVFINWEGAYASEYEVQFSVDAVDWETVYSTDEGSAGVKVIEIPSKVTSYIKIVCKEAATQYGYSIWEVEAYGNLHVLGDFNSDSVVNILDLVRFKKYFANDDRKYHSSVDFDKNGLINADDLTSLRKLLLVSSGKDGKVMRILFQGDSITDWGRDHSNPHDLGDGYAKYAARALQAAYPEIDFEFINLGISGNQTLNLVSRLQTDVINIQPDIVSIMIGINDTWHHAEDRSWIPNDVFEERYRTILTEIREKTDAKIMILEPFLLPVEDKLFFREDLDPKIQIISRLASEFADVYMPTDDLLASAIIGKEPTDFAPDGVHPSAKGAAYIGKWYAEYIAEIIDETK